MSHLIHRRLNGKNKSAVNRERFLRRFRAQIRQSVARAIKGRSITDISSGEKVSIPVRDVSEPTFHHGSGGTREVVHPGNEEFVTGDRIARPEAVQDTASQFVELGHRFSTGQVKLVPGAQVNFSMARPGGIDEWTYDVIGEETLHLPRLGPVPTLHLKPRPLSKPRGPISAEIWYAPSLQYLPVRIRITQGNDNYIDLMVDTIEQR